MGRGVLPAYFAVPAGWGDVVTGVGAVGVAAAVAADVRGWRAATAARNAFGVADLVVAAGAGTTLLAGALSTVLADGPSAAALVALPLATIPLFLVPTSLTLHVYSLWRLTTDPADGPAPDESGAAGRAVDGRAVADLVRSSPARSRPVPSRPVPSARPAGPDGAAG